MTNEPRKPGRPKGPPKPPKPKGKMGQPSKWPPELHPLKQSWKVIPAVMDDALKDPAFRGKIAEILKDYKPPV